MLRSQERVGLHPPTAQTETCAAYDKGFDVIVEEEKGKSSTGVDIGAKYELATKGMGRKNTNKNLKAGGELEAEMEATGPGAAGDLSGATDSTRQEP
jgi:hypothetical protein